MVLLNAGERESLYRDLREQDPDLWEPACHRLGEMAATDTAAYRTLCDLLLSTAPELKLRGLVALRILAPAKPLEVGRFLTDRVAEARRNHDPVLLDVTFFAFTALPEGAGRDLVAGYLSDAHEGIRTAAAAALSFWRDWPDGTLQKLALDPSVEVRAALIISLAELEDSPDRRRALEILREQDDPLLRELLEELRNEPPDFPDPTPAVLDQAGVRQVMQSLRPTPAEIARLEEAVARDFETTLETIRQGLESPGSALVLSLLGDVCRDNGVGTLFRAWSCVLRNSHESALDHLLSVLGVIEGHYEGDFLLPLREFLKACVSAVDAEQLTDLLAWSYERQVTTAGMALWNPASMEGAALHPQAQNWLDILARLGAEFEGTSLFQLSHLNSELARALIELESDCPRPERDLLQAVVSEWRQILETETEAMMGGVSV